jgi:hypothetical protein
MTDEQELPGASSNPRDAPSLEAPRRPKRQLQPSQRLRDIQASQTASEHQRRKTRKRKSDFTVFEDQLTPPPTQQTSQSTQGLFQEGTDYAWSQKRRRKSVGKSAQSSEQWELDVDTVSTNQAKFEVLLQALGHENFPEVMHIPERDAKPVFDERLDPLDPLSLWKRFITPQVLETIAQHTNENETLSYQSKEEHTQHERPWRDVTGDDIGAFLGAAMLMGVHPQASITDYWNCSEDKPFFPLQSYMTRVRFQQICRFLKVNSPHEELNTAEFFYKLEPLLSSFREASQQLILLPSTVSIDENLIAAQTRTPHLIQIDSKAARKGYKIYTLACGSYLYDWIYTSKKAKVPQAKFYVPRSQGYQDDAFTDTERTVLTLVEAMLKSQPEGFQFQVIFDNFFTTTRLFDELRTWGVGAFGTAKSGSGIPKPHITVDKVATKEKNYGEVVNTVVSNGRVNCITFIDNGAVWMMSTVHDTANELPCWRPIAMRKNASLHLARTTPAGDLEIPYPQISHDYNQKMNGSDLCQQSWDEYDLSNHAHQRNWWPLFWHLINASISNVLYLYRLQGFTDSTLTHLQLQERLGLQLLKNPAAVSRKIELETYSLGTRPTLIQRPTNEHSWTRITPRDCVVCIPPRTLYRRRRGKQAREARDALKELGINIQPPVKHVRKRKRTTWGCLECEVALCKESHCWQRHHGQRPREDETDSQSDAMSISSFESL